MRPSLIATLAIAGAVLSACTLPTLDKEADAKARALYEQIRSGADLAASPDLAPELKTPAALAQLAAVKASLPAEAPTAVANQGFNISIENGQSSARLVHAYSYPARTILAETVLRKDETKTWKIIGFHVKTQAPGQGPGAKPAEPAVSVDDPARDI
ncbi:MAG: hypothetical protein V4466_18220 [Pseudomonadota bacterium]